jgi:hypothetical protein
LRRGRRHGTKHVPSMTCEKKPTLHSILFRFLLLLRGRRNHAPPQLRARSWVVVVATHRGGRRVRGAAAGCVDGAPGPSPGSRRRPRVPRAHLSLCLRSFRSFDLSLFTVERHKRTRRSQRACVSRGACGGRRAGLGRGRGARAVVCTTSCRAPANEMHPNVGGRDSLCKIHRASQWTSS